MSLSVRNETNGELLEKVIIQNDLSGLTPIEKVQHIKNVCNSLGLNPLTKPIQLLKFQGKEIPYVTKDATEQLRKINKVSISIQDTKMINSDVYIVVVEASTPDGRKDSSTGAISIKDLKGDALCNAMLKAETKAKRRATLSICGLGFIDESEADSIPESKKVDVYSEENRKTTFLPIGENKLVDQKAMNDDFEAYKHAIKQAKNEKEIKSLYEESRSMFKDSKDILSALKIASVERKNEIADIAYKEWSGESKNDLLNQDIPL